VKEKYSTNALTIDYIITRRLNQDILENLFSYVRAMGNANDHPSPVELQHRLKWYILGKHSGHALSMKKNTEDEMTSVSFMDIEDVYKNSSCMSDCLDLQEDDDLTKEAKLFMQVDHVETFAVNEGYEEEIDEENEGILFGIKLLLY